VQPKAIAHPTDARLCHRALEELVDLAHRSGVNLRQSYRRLAKRAAIMVGRYTHAHQFERARRELKFLRTRLGRVIRDILRKIAGNPELPAHFAEPAALAVRVRFQDHRQRGPKVYALHAPAVEHRQGQGQGAVRVRLKSLPLRKRGCRWQRRRPSPRAASSCCTPRRGTATRSTVTPWAGRRQIGAADRGRDPPHPRRQGLSRHNHPEKFHVWITGQVRRVTATIPREMKRRAAVEPVIGHLKAKHRMGRYHLKGCRGDRANAVLAAAGYNFALLLR